MTLITGLFDESPAGLGSNFFGHFPEARFWTASSLSSSGLVPTRSKGAHLNSAAAVSENLSRIATMRAHKNGLLDRNRWR